MRTEATTRELYTFAELSEDAKETARENWRRIEAESGDISWSEFAIEAADTIAAMLGITIRRCTVRLMNGATREEPAIEWSLSYSQGDGAGFDASYQYAKGSAKAIRKYAPQDAELHRIADALTKVQRRHFYKLWADVECTDRYFNVRASVETDGPEDVSRKDAEEIEQAVRDFAQWIYDQLRREDEYRMSDECIDDYLSGDDSHEFLIDGTLA